MDELSLLDFGSSRGAAGVEGLFGEHYWFHRYTRPDFHGMGFVSKTFTVEPRLGHEPGKGNAKLKDDGTTLVDKFPSCVKVSLRRGAVDTLNAFGLSNPGVKAGFEKGELQKRTEPWTFSFMALGTPSQKEEQRRECASLFKHFRSKCRAPFSLQENGSCPNVGQNAGNDPFAIPEYDPPDDAFLREITQSLKIFEPVGILHEVKLSVTTSPGMGAKITKDPRCAGLCVSNTIPWGRFSDRIPWESLFGSKESPLKHLGGGGLSGPLLLLLVVDWLLTFRTIDLESYVNAGGGVFYPEDVNLVANAGANSIFIGTVATLRPWRVGPIIRRAEMCFGLQ